METLLSSGRHLTLAGLAAPFAGTALVGCAGWSIAREAVACFPTEGSLLTRYSSVFGAVEINSSFYRPHKPSTYARWAARVPKNFKFSVKLPKQISHTLRLSESEQVLAQFAAEVGALEENLGCILVQLPPSYSYDAAVADRFFALMRQYFACMLACEARNPSWFGTDASRVLEAHSVTRVEADPLHGKTGAFKPTTQGRYLRLHGSPKVYYSSYSHEFLATLRTELSDEKRPAWVIFDNTASGAAIVNALSLRGGCGGG